MDAISIIGVTICFMGVMALPVAMVVQIFLEKREERKAKKEHA